MSIINEHEKFNIMIIIINLFCVGHIDDYVVNMPYTKSEHRMRCLSVANVKFDHRVYDTPCLIN
jgi:hypothetical protein